MRPLAPRWLIALDLDGTLLRRDGTVSERTVAALAAARDHGSRVVFATGRPLRQLPAVAELTGHRGLILCHNGAALWRAADQTLLWTRPFGPGQARAAAETLRAAVPDLMFGVETPAGLTGEQGWVEPAAALDWDQPALELLVHHPDLGPAELAEVARAELTGLATPAWGGVAGALELTAPGVDKGSALAELAADPAYGGLPVAAFGDMPNDLGMLRYADAGWAMAAAHPDLAEAADATAPDCDEDGVAQVVERLVRLAAAS